MKLVNIAMFKNNLSKFLSLVEKGEEIKVCKRNIEIAKLIPIQPNDRKNHTKLGCGLGSAKTLTDLTKPMIPLGDWEMLNDETSS